MQDDGHYIPFAKVFTLNTTEQDPSSLKGKKAAKPLSYSLSVQHARNTVMIILFSVMSALCMWRVVFSKRKQSVAAHSTLQAILEDVSYTCGASLDNLDFPDIVCHLL